MEPVVIPAILAKTKEELLQCISQVNGLVREIQLDIMDGDFVPNKTVGLDELVSIPVLRNARYEFHWMVRNPEKWIERIPGRHMHLVHVETITSFAEIEAAVRKSGGKLGLAINPETPLEALLPFASKAQRILVMTVHPGFSGQKYLVEMEKKISALRARFPKLDIEVDGGVNLETVRGAYSAGANVLAAASAIFASPDKKLAIEKLRARALGGGNQ